MNYRVRVELRHGEGMDRGRLVSGLMLPPMWKSVSPRGLPGATSVLVEDDGASEVLPLMWKNGKGAGQQTRRAGSILSLSPDGLKSQVRYMLLQASNFSFPFPLPSAPSPWTACSPRPWLLPLASTISPVSDSHCFFSHGLDINISVAQSSIVF